LEIREARALGVFALKGNRDHSFRVVDGCSHRKEDRLKTKLGGGRRIRCPTARYLVGEAAAALLVSLEAGTNDDVVLRVRGIAGGG
jgi:hypothetical protein